MLKVSVVKDCFFNYSVFSLVFTDINIDICKLFVKRAEREQTTLKIKYHVKNL